MERLTEEALFDLDKFNKCQLCGREDDICCFRMWLECDDHDQPEEGIILIICATGECRKRLENHERLYYEIPWGQGGPGKFMLLCGNCPNRERNQCKHPHLKANGGNGLYVEFADWPLSNTIICTTGGCFTGAPKPAVGCEGLPESYDRHVNPKD